MQNFISRIGQGGGGGGDDKHIYSTVEKEVGTWTDGRKIYEKTFFYTGTITIAYDNIAQLFTGSFYDCILFDFKIFQYSTNRVFKNFNAWIANGNLVIYNNRPSAIPLTNPIFILQYIRG